MNVPIKCRRCGYSGPSHAMFFGNANVRFVNTSTNCPNCGAMVAIEDGSYQFLEGVLAAFRTPEMTLEKVLAAQRIAQEASEGSIKGDTAIDRLIDVSEDLARAIRAMPAAEAKGINWELVLAILAFILGLWNTYGSDQAARAALDEEKTQTKLMRDMVDAARAQVSEAREPSASRVSTNRHERRKAAALARRKPSLPRPS